MTENEPTDEKRAWLRELIARSQSNAGGGIFAPKSKPNSANDQRSTE